MKFGFVMKSQGIPEWKDMYLNYKILKKLVKPYKTMAKSYMKINYLGPMENNDHSIITITNANLQFFEELKHFGLKFEEIVISECIKISTFFELKLLEELKRWKLFKININILQNIQNDKDYDKKKIQLLNAFHYFYKELNLLYEFISVNQEGLRKILKKFKKNSKSLDLKYKSLKKHIRELISKSCLKNAIQKLIFLRTEVETRYIDTFYKKYDRKDGQNTLRKISQGKLMTHQETFFFGFFLGFCCLLVIVIFALSWLLDLNIDDLAIFPVFKGIALILFYYWGLAINVYFWTKSNLNYKLIFQFNFHFSEISEIFKRASYFTIIFLVALVGYLILNFHLEKLGEISLVFPKNLCPLIIWFSFFGYCFFPSTQYFNPLGRMFVFKALKQIFIGPFKKNGICFRDVWGLEQMMSFAGIARDFLYTVLFYCFAKFSVKENQHFVLGYYFIFLVLFFQTCQSLRILFDSFSWRSVQFIEIAKNICVFSFVFLDFEVTSGFSLFFLSLCVSCLISAWDLVGEWGLVIPSSKFRFLRKELSFESRYLYYFFMIGNFLLRVCWVLTLLPNTLQVISRNPLILFFIETLEMVRRSLWNFLVIEKHHIMNCGIFKAVEEIKLPYEDIHFELNELKFFEDDLKLPNAKKNEKFGSEIHFPLLNSEHENSSVDGNNNSDTCKHLLEKESDYSIKLEELFSPDNKKNWDSREEIFKAQILNDNKSKFNKSYFENVRCETKEFCNKVKLNMEFQFKVIKEQNNCNEEEEIKKISLSIKKKPSIN